MNQKKYNQEFKQTVVELYRSGTPVNQLSSEYGVSKLLFINGLNFILRLKGQMS
ncbi:hypothetical protein SAMN05880501_101191 [Ureibacillus xyleni]|uniref:Transposase n=1 Tax=Ureibacillus xyleni TaxID=614648 RepID=A0A285R981_9BACL|nr:hypothetical protein SAMN05880501_101191 [Ureibacillus xyleni]